MAQDRHFAFKKAQVEGFVKKGVPALFREGRPDFHSQASEIHGAHYSKGGEKIRQGCPVSD